LFCFFRSYSHQAEIHFHGAVLAELYVKKHINVSTLLTILHTPEALEAFLVEYGAGLIEHLGDEIDRIENEIKKLNPQVRHIDLEVD
jgi:solute carrier family 30 (zinc transporter), member 9